MDSSRSNSPIRPTSKLWFLRSIEILGLFFVLPGALAFMRSIGSRAPVLEVLWIAAIVSIIILSRSKTFRRSSFWNMSGALEGLPGVLIRVGICSGLLFLTALIFFPDQIFEFPRRNLLVWAIVMVAYPIFSVFPQGVVYRNWFVHRYGVLFGDRITMIIVAAIAFSFCHIVFLNWIALGLTFVGGLIFTRTYLQHRSGLLADIEHALLGNAVFTIGFGNWLYLGANQ